jgi:hypothetical protein
MFNASSHASDGRRPGGRAGLVRLTPWMLAIAILAGCAGAASNPQPARVVMAEHDGWIIRVTPSFSYADDRWRAAVDVWPPDRNPETYPGIRVHFTDAERDQGVVVKAATDSARHYIDASRARH